VRRNFLLLYELLDECFDRGCPQGISRDRGSERESAGVDRE